MLVLRIALRGLRRSPGFTTAAVLVLGLGLGANTILFNAVYALLWRPLPFPDPDRLAAVSNRSARGTVNLVATGRQMADIKDRVPSVAEIGMLKVEAPLAVVLDPGPIDLESASVNSGYLRALGLRPLLGRLFNEQEDLGRSPERTAILMESAWRAHFGADPSIVGRTFSYLDGAARHPVRIVGVLRDAGTLPYATSPQILTSIPWLHPQVRTDRGTLQYRTVIRMKRGVQLRQASDQVTSALAASDQELPANQRGGRAFLVPLRSALTSGSRTPVWLLYAAAGLLLLLTTTNVASLFLARAISRRHETAVRTALGASLAHTLRAHFAEAIVVCLAGLAVALALNEFAQPLIPQLLPELEQVGPELLRTGDVLILFGVACCLVVACVLAALPVVQARRVRLIESFAEDGKGGTGRSRWQEMLAAAQLAVILVLLAVGSLIGRSFVEALQSDPGFDPRHVLTFRAMLPVGGDARAAAAYDLARIARTLPGTTSVAFSAESPLGGTYACIHSTRSEPFAATDPMIFFRLVGSGYFETLRAHLVKGRFPTEAEVRASTDVAVLNEAAARLLFGGSDPVGRTVHASFGGNILTIVGIVGDMRTSGLDLAGDPMVYRPFLPMGSGAVFTMRTSQPVDQFMSMLQPRVRAWNPAVLLRDVTSIDVELRKTIRGRLRAAMVVGIFALLGLLVGTIGLYGTLSAQVERLRREIGIRLALGASSDRIVTGVLTRGGRLIAWGTLIGLAGSGAAAAMVRHQLYGIAPWDVLSFVLAIVLLSAAALGASLLPALRAARIDPAEALRHQ